MIITSFERRIDDLGKLAQFCYWSAMAIPQGKRVTFSFYGGVNGRVTLSRPNSDRLRVEGRVGCRDITCDVPLEDFFEKWQLLAH